MALSVRLTVNILSRLIAFGLIATILMGASGMAIAAPPDYDPLLPDYQDAYAERFDDELIAYDIDIRFRPEFNRITGEMTVSFPNFTGEPLTDIAFRLFPNAVYYGEGYLHIISAEVDGRPVDHTYDDTRTALFVPLPEPLEPDRTATVDLAFRTVIPVNSRGTYGIFTHHLATDTWVLADWHPIVAGWDAELGWRTDPPTSQGDPTYADTGLYELAVTLPARFSVVATGIERAVEPVSSTTERVIIASGPARDLTLLISDRLVPTEGLAGETVVRVWAEPDAGGQAAAAWVLAESIAALDAWGERYGTYPSVELDLVATPIQQAVLGISWSGIIMLSDALLLVDTAWIERDPETARFAIVHEIGHQWWGNMIGSNSNDHPFMVEGLTNALCIDIALDLYGSAAALSMLEAQMAGRYRDALLRFGDDVVDQAVGAENPNGPGRAALAYGKGALGFLAIRLEIGDDAWFATMRAYADTWLYRNAEPADLLAMLIANAPDGVDVAAIWTRWFEESVTTVDEIDALFAGMAQRLMDAS